MKRIFRAVMRYFTYLCLCRGSKIKYLRSRGMRIGTGCEIMTSITSFGSEPYLIEIGNRCTVSGNALLITHDGSSRIYRDQVEGNKLFGNLYGKILIEDDCFVGAGAIILPGVRISSKSIVAAGAVVTTDVPASCVVAGNPARVISSIENTISKHKLKMVSHQSKSREELRENLTRIFWGETR